MKTLVIFLAMFCGSFYTSDTRDCNEECKITNLSIRLDLESAEEYSELDDLKFEELIPCITDEGLLQLEVNCKNLNSKSKDLQTTFNIKVSGNGKNQSEFLKRINQLKQSVKSFYNI